MGSPVCRQHRVYPRVSEQAGFRLRYGCACVWE